MADHPPWPHHPTGERAGVACSASNSSENSIEWEKRPRSKNGLASLRGLCYKGRRWVAVA